MTVKETAATLRCSVATVYRLLARGELARTKVGRRTVVTPESIADYISANTRKEVAA